MFHMVMLPKKILARRSPVKFRCVVDEMPGMLYAGTTPLPLTGIVSRVEFAGRAAYCVVFSGASLSPKFTVPAVICAIPAPLPTGL